jgi:two-component system response regulator (stage 0 sporulation protein F)
VAFRLDVTICRTRARRQAGFPRCPPGARSRHRSCTDAAPTMSCCHRCLTVLLAEDDDDLRAVLVGLLQRDGHRVLEIRDGGDLLAVMASARFEGDDLCEDVLVVTDLRMPVVDSLSVMKTLRAQGKQPRFILMTAFGDAELHTRARGLGALAVFDKPFDFDDLRAAVRQAAHRVAMNSF